MLRWVLGAVAPGIVVSLVAGLALVAQGSRIDGGTLDLLASCKPLEAPLLGTDGPFQPAPAEVSPGTINNQSPDASGVRISDFSGLPVPRYASTRNSQVNVRAGPSIDYPVRTVIECQLVPVLITRESQDWRKIQDPWGQEGWVNASLLGRARTALTTRSGVLYKEASSFSSPVSNYAAGAVVRLRSCDNDWCNVGDGVISGWVPSRDLWGVDDIPAGVFN